MAKAGTEKNELLLSKKKIFCKINFYQCPWGTFILFLADLSSKEDKV